MPSDSFMYRTNTYRKPCRAPGCKAEMLSLAHALLGETDVTETRRRSHHPSLELFWNEEGEEGVASRVRNRCKDPGVGPSKPYWVLVKDERRRKRDPTERAKSGVTRSGAWIILGNIQKQKSSSIQFHKSLDPSQRCLISIFTLTWPK